MSSKIKSRKKIERPCTSCFTPQYLKFNFSYTENINNLQPEYKAQLLNVMLRLSDSTYLTILQRDKTIGIEMEDKDKLGIHRAYPANFTERFPVSQFNNKVAVVRLYSNDNPILGRIIGVIIKNVFYVFFIDIGGKLYQH